MKSSPSRVRRHWRELASALSGVASSGRLSEARRLRYEAMLRASAFGLAEIAETLKPDAPRLLLVIDQFEELFRFGDGCTGAVRAAMREEARAFVELLLTAGKHDGGGVHICVTMRSDYFGNCSAYLGLAEAVSESQFLVPLPLRGQMEEAIRAPVAKAGGAIEEALVQRLLVDVAEETDQLPLLQHTLRRLWERASGDPRTMREDDYVAVGRIAGSIDKKAEGVLMALTQTDPMNRTVVERVMKALTDVDEHDRATRRPQKHSELRALVNDSLSTDPAIAEASLDRALEALKIEDTSFLQFGDGEDPEIDIGHEALIRSWKRLAGPKLDFAEGWLREERADGDRWRGFVRRAGEGPPLTWTEQRTLPKWLLERGENWSRRYGNRWAEVAEFLTKSRRNTSFRLMAVGVGVFALVLGVDRFADYISSRNSAHIARLDALSLADRARAAAKDGDSRLAALLAVDALRSDADVSDGQKLPQPEGALIDALARPIEIARLPLGSRVWSAKFSPDGRLIAAVSDDKKLHIWNTKTLEPRHFDEMNVKDVISANFAPDLSGGILVGSMTAGEVSMRLWDAVTGTPSGHPISESPCLSLPAFSPNGGQIVASIYDPIPNDAGGPRAPGENGGASRAGDTLGLCRWDAKTGTVIDTPKNPHLSRVWRVVGSPDGNRYVSLSIGENSPRLWDAKTGKLVGQLSGHTGQVTSAAFSPDGSRIVSTSEDNTLRVWDANSGEAIGEPLRGHTGSVNDAAFSPDGLRIVSASNDNTLRLWDGTTRQPIGPPIRGHLSSVYSVSFSLDGRHVVSGSDDMSVRVWDVGGPTGKFLGLPFQGHADTVETVAFSPPDGKLVVSASDDKTLRLWDAKTGRLIGQPLRGHSDVVYSAAFSPDGRRIVSASVDRTLRLWDATNGKPIGEPLRGHEDKVTSAVYSPDGTRIVSTSFDHTLRLWDATTGKQIGEPLRGHTDIVFNAAFSPDGRRIVSASFDHTLRLWDATNGLPIGEPLRGHEDRVTSAVYSPDGTRIVSSSMDRTLRLWDASTGQAIGEPLKGHTAGVDTVAFSPDGRQIVSASVDKTLRLWDARTGRPIGEPLRGHNGEVDTAVFSPDGRSVVSGSVDRTIRIWDVRTGESTVWPAAGHAGAVLSAAFSPDGRRIVSASADHTLRLWDASSGQPIGDPLPGHEDKVTSAAFSPDGARLVSTSADKTLRLWDAKTGQPIGDPLRGHEDAVTSAAFSPDGARIVSTSADKTVRLWDASKGQPIGEPLRGHEGQVTSAVFSPDGKRIVSTSTDGTLRLWNASNGQPIGDPLRSHEKDATNEKPIGGPLRGNENAVTSAAFSPDGKIIVSGSADRTLRLWNAASGKPILHHPLKGHTDRVNSVAFSPDGRFIVSASDDGTLRLWDARTGLPIGAPLPGHNEPVRSAAFSPDGARIVSASDDATLRLWTLDFLAEPSSAEAKADRLCPLSGDEREEHGLVDPMAGEPAPTPTGDQLRACGEAAATAAGP